MQSCNKYLMLIVLCVCVNQLIIQYVEEKVTDVSASFSPTVGCSKSWSLCILWQVEIRMKNIPPTGQTSHNYNFCSEYSGLVRIRIITNYFKKLQNVDRRERRMRRMWGKKRECEECKYEREEEEEICVR